jgi:hypothetical protein
LGAVRILAADADKQTADSGEQGRQKSEVGHFRFASLSLQISKPVTMLL